jgi:hypothetical protein
MSTLKSSNEPRNGGVVLARTLLTLYRGDATTTPLRQLKPEDIRFGAHHAVYDLDLPSIAHGAGLTSAQRSGSRWLLSKDEETQFAIEIATDAKGLVAGEFKSINAGPFVEGTAAALRLSEAWPDSEKYEFALLRVAALRLWMLWLTPVGAGQAARFWALPPAPPAFKTTSPYDEAALLAVLQPLAQAALQTGANPPGTLVG